MTDSLAPHPMTVEQVADLIARVRANETPNTRSVRQASKVYWARWRAERGQP